MNLASQIQLGGSRIDNGASLRVHRSMGAVAGMCEIAIPTPVDASAAPGDDVSVSIGPVDKTATVFTGALDAMESRGSYVVFRALDSRVIAARTRVNQMFEEQKTDAILRDLGSAADLDMGQVATGVPVIMYLADDSRSVLGHMCHLADLGGAHLFVDREGSLQILSYLPSAPTLQLGYGEHVLAVSASERQGGGSVEVRTEGAASTNGPPAAFWPTTDTSSVAGTTSGDGPQIMLWRPELRSMASAMALAVTTALRRAQRTRRVTVSCLGIPDIELGDTLLVSAVPGAVGPMLVRVVAIEHRFNHRDGFISNMTMEGLGD